MPTSPSFRHIPPKAQSMGEGGGGGDLIECVRIRPRFPHFWFLLIFDLRLLERHPPFEKISTKIQFKVFTLLLLL